MSLDLVTEELMARQPAEAQAIIRLLLAKLAAMELKVVALEAELRALKKTPQNSSLPPGSQHPHARPVPRAAKSGRPRGGQPGQARFERPLIPSDECDEVISLKPPACRQCGGALCGEDPQPLRHQVGELPEIRPLVAESQRQRLICTSIGDFGFSISSG